MPGPADAAAPMDGILSHCLMVPWGLAGAGCRVQMGDGCVRVLDAALLTYRTLHKFDNAHRCN